MHRHILPNTGGARSAMLGFMCALDNHGRSLSALPREKTQAASDRSTDHLETSKEVHGGRS